MTEEGNSGFWLSVFSAAGFLITWFAMAMSHGKAKGIAEARAKQIRTDLDELKIKQNKDILEVRQTFKQEMSEIRGVLSGEFDKLEAHFHNADGDQRFLTVPQHEKLCADQKNHWEDIKGYQKKHASELVDLRVAVGRIDEKLNSMIDKKHNIQQGPQ